MLPLVAKVNRLKKLKQQRIDQAALMQTLNTGEPLVVWKPFPGKPQEMAYNWPVDELFYGGAGGAGKGGVCYGTQWAIDNLNSFTVDRYDSIIDLVPEHIRAMDSKVLMWDGQWKGFSEIKVGDRIMNPDGQMQAVLQVFERGEQETYTVSFEDGTSVYCDEDHLWGFWKAGENTRRKTCSGRKPIEDTSDPINWNINYISRAMVRDTRWMYEEVSKGARLIIPIAAPLNFTQLHRGNISRAYLYGALIGDGSIQAHRFGGSGIRLSSADEWIIERCTAVLEKFCRYDYEGRAPDVVIKDKWVDQWARNTGLLGKYSHEKFLPDGYLKESLEFRWALAQGLFDTDGYASASKNEVSYCTVSPVLADGVANLVRSLGFMAKIREKQGVCYTDGKAKEGRMAYIVAVEGNDRWRLFSLPRKVELAQASEPILWVGKAIVGIEKKDKVYCRCIQVSNPNGLYITDGYNVTHNTDLLLGLAGTKHTRSLILRREFPRLRALIERSREIYNRLSTERDKDSYNESLHLWRLKDGKTIQLGSIQYEKDWVKFQGQPHDLKGFDEITEFTEKQFRSINIWNRTADPNQECRVVCTGNPPTDSEGEWVIDYWGPWLDEDHPEPAMPGDLVWYVRISGIGEEDDRDLEIGRTSKAEVEAYLAQGKRPPRPSITIGDRVLEGRSRTFIPGRVEDNPTLMATGYDKLLDALPHALRIRFRDGVFRRTQQVSDFQVIPPYWVDLAMKRWQQYDLEAHKAATKQSVISCDPARGGPDRTAIAIRYDDLIEVFSKPGEETPDGASVAQFVLEHMRLDDEPTVCVDVIGVGTSPYDKLVELEINTVAMSSSDASTELDRSRKLKFKNKRSEWWWKLREALDPDHGATLALPPIKGLKSELCAPHWSLAGQTITVEPKKDVKERLGRSPDLADAVVYACQDVAFTSRFRSTGARTSQQTLRGQATGSLRHPNRWRR